MEDSVPWAAGRSTNCYGTTLDDSGIAVEEGGEIMKNSDQAQPEGMLLIFFKGADTLSGKKLVHKLTHSTPIDTCNNNIMSTFLNNAHHTWKH